ncbi:CAP domain-containing protein [Stratiformator vulcanicus]|uniref:Cysteine-rich secretory protein family protein n=1 Tax=Stratiformator vulcanicus TaxID=2527980 RepID=A0A517R7I9_9PLAN|nr:CAP domain-containing protein [Stratiformator vulcanicus]QDT39850.1 Cysteine-rich secretory protein family protein [Stratiformator vulcanicus]
MLSQSRFFLPLALLVLTIAVRFPADVSSSFALAEETTQKVPETSGESPGAVDPDLDRAVELIIERTNKFRSEHERDALKKNDKLNEAAVEFAKFMAENDEYGHEADGSKPHERVAATGYEYCHTSENIALQFRSKGFKTADLAKRFAEGWINSEGHRRNMLHPAVTQTAVAIRQSEKSGKYYAVQLFGRPQSASIRFKILNKTQSAIQCRWGNRTMKIPARAGWIYRMCQPGELTFYALDDDAAEPQFQSKPFAKFAEADGRKFEVTSKDGELAVSSEKVEEAIEIPSKANNGR